MQDWHSPPLSVLIAPSLKAHTIPFPNHHVTMSLFALAPPPPMSSNVIMAPKLYYKLNHNPITIISCYLSITHYIIREEFCVVLWKDKFA